ncbi:thioredoxin family protein [Priestia megaterium]|uniref:thioredoxin family protein n=1 Tax=Priestia megaterium TaxID=1404 RepID=UPI0032424D55
MKKWIFSFVILIACASVLVFVFSSTGQDKPLYTNIDLKEYEKNVQSKDKFLVYVYQTSCPACQKTRPVLNKLIEEKNTKVLAINVEDEKNFDTAFLKEYKLNKTPAFVYYEHGEEKERLVGFHSASELEKFIIR